MFGGELQRRLYIVEEHIKNQNIIGSESKIVEAKLSTQIETLAISLKEYTAKEEVFMRDHAHREETAARDNLEVLTQIKADIQTIKFKQESQPTDINLLLTEQKIATDEVNKTLFVSKIEGTRIFKHLKYLWVCVGILVVTYFGNDKLKEVLSDIF